MIDEIQNSCSIPTFNPDREFCGLMESLIEKVQYIMIVDNASKNYSEIKQCLNTLNYYDKSRIEILSNYENLGIAKALNDGIEKITPRKVDFILTLDQDAMLLDISLDEIIDKAYSYKPNMIGSIALSDEEYNNQEFTEVSFAMTNGNLIPSNIFNFIKYRDSFFIDQIDFDFSANLQRSGYSILRYNRKVLKHRLGILKEGLIYEKPFRIYYIFRNSTILYLERKIPFYMYCHQLKFWASNQLRSREYGLLDFLFPAIIGVIHGLLKIEGFNKNFRPY